MPGGIALVDASVVREQCVVDICYHLTVCFALSRHGSLWYLLFTAKYVIFHRSSIAALSWTTKVQQSTSARYAPPAACMRGTTTDPLCHIEPFVTVFVWFPYALHSNFQLATSHPGMVLIYTVVVGGVPGSGVPQGC